MSDEEKQAIQDDEKLAIKSIFCEDAKFAEQKWKVWRPLEVTIHLTPQASCSHDEMGGEKKREVSLDFHVTCSKEYPDRPPTFLFSNVKGISLDTSKILSDILVVKAKELIGNAMIMDLCEEIREFLSKQDNRAVLSFHETMMKTKENAAVESNRRRLDSERRELELVAEEQERIAVERQMNENLVKQLAKNRIEGECRMIGGRKIVVLANMPVRDRKLHSFCKEWNGFWDNTQHLISEWTFRYTLGRNANDAKKRDFEPFVKKLEDVIDELQPLIAISKKDPNLVEYSFIHVQKTAVTSSNLLIHVFIGQKVLIGEQNMLDAYQMVATSARLMRLFAAQAVCGLRYLHEQPSSHSALGMATVWLRDNVFRFTDFGTLAALLNLCNYFNDIVIGGKRLNETDRIEEHEKPRRRDLFQLGTVLDELVMAARSSDYSRAPTPEKDSSSLLTKFIAKCQEAKNIEQLVEDPYINSVPDVPLSGSDDILTSFGGVMDQHSRVMQEFVVIRMLGKGGFGDVLLARNKMDSMDYAVKRIPLNAGNERLNRRIKKEAKLFAKLNHPNVVRYFSAWAEDLNPIESDTDSDLECAVPIPGKPAKSTKKKIERNRAGREPSFSAEEAGDSMLPPQLRAIEREAAKAARNRLIVAEPSEWSTSYRVNEKSVRSSLSSDSDEDDEECRVNGKKSNMTSNGIHHSAGRVQTLFSPSIGDDDLDVFWEDSEKDDEDEEEETEESSVFERVSSCSDCSDIVFGDSSKPTTDEKQEEPMEKSISKNVEPQTPKISPRPKVLIIQMEYCERGTLRQMIDEEVLINDPDLCWRIFSEILCGLQYIHNQGMIHRDIKPLNIFLNSQQNVKIGDFGLATRDFFRDQKKAEKSASIEKVDQTRDIGTQLYMAPELFLEETTGKVYTSKIDVFSCGVVLFEMFYRPLLPGMERISTLEALKNSSTIPVDFGSNLTTARRTIEWMLNSNPDSRPTVDQLLNDENLPMNKGEDAQFQKQFQRILKKRGSRQHAWLLDTLFNEEMPAAVNYCYDSDICKERYFNSREHVIENLREEFGCILKSHAYELMHMHTMTPCLTARAAAPVRLKPVEYMDRSGISVALPVDLRQNFVRFCVRNAINRMKRYNFGRVYWSDEARGNTHPQERWECSVDSVGLRSTSMSMDGEILVTACQLISSSLKGLKLTLRIGHIQLIETVLRHLKVSEDFRGDVLNMLHCFSTSDKTLTLPEKVRQLGEVIGKKSASSLLHNLPCEPTLSRLEEALRHLIRSRDEPIRLATSRVLKELSDIFNVFKLAASDDVMRDIRIVFDAATSYRPRTFGDGLVFQILVEVPNKRNNNTMSKMVSVLAGGRYDSSLERERHPGDGDPFPRCLTGFAVSMDIVAEIRRRCGMKTSPECCTTLICSLVQADGNLLLAEKFRIAKVLWANKMQADVLHEPVTTVDQLNDHCEKKTISHILAVCNSVPEIFVKSHQITHGKLQIDEAIKTICQQNDKYLKLSLPPLTLLATSSSATLHHHHHHHQTSEDNDVMTTMSTPLVTSRSASSSQLCASSAVARTGSVALTANMSNLNVCMAVPEKMSKKDRKRIESQVRTHLADELSVFGVRSRIEVIVCDVSKELVKKVIGEITRRSTKNEIEVFFDQLSRQNHGRSATDLDALGTQLCTIVTSSPAHHTPRYVCIIYSHSDNFHRVLT